MDKFLFPFVAVTATATFRKVSYFRADTVGQFPCFTHPAVLKHGPLCVIA